MYTHSITYRAYFEAEGLEEAKAKLEAISAGESTIWVDGLPGFYEKLRVEEAEIDLDTLEGVN